MLYWQQDACLRTHRTRSGDDRGRPETMCLPETIDNDPKGNQFAQATPRSLNAALSQRYRKEVLFILDCCHDGQEERWFAVQSDIALNVNKIFPRFKLSCCRRCVESIERHAAWCILTTTYK